MPSLIWVSRETEIKNRFRSHTWLLFQVSHFILFRHLPWLIQTAASTGPGSSHVQMCRSYLCFRASFHCTPGFCSSWDASTSVTSASILSVFHLPFIPFCPPSHLVPPSLSPFRVFLCLSLAYKTLSKSGSEPSGLLLNGGNWQHMCLSAAKQTTHTHLQRNRHLSCLECGVDESWVRTSWLLYVSVFLFHVIHVGLK